MAKSRLHTHKFRDRKLNEHIVPPRVSLLLRGHELDEELAVTSASLSREMAAKFRLLFAEFGLSESDPSDWLHLAFKLASLYVPGMQVSFVRHRPGRPNSSGITSNPILLLMVIDMIKSSEKIESDRKACEFFAISQAKDDKGRLTISRADVAKRVRSLANLVSKARKDAAETRQ